jgi:hypothetical protein
MIFLLNYLQGKEYLCYHIQNYPHLTLKKRGKIDEMEVTLEHL